MSKNSIGLHALAVTFSMFQVGSTTLFFLGSQAKQDAWLAMLLGAAAGLLLLAMYLGIHHLDARYDLYELNKVYFGKIIGSIFGLAFIAYFTYEASRNLRDLSELTVATLLNRTPLFVVAAIALLVIVNCVRYGPKINFLTCIALLPVMILGYGSLIVLILTTGVAHFEFMQPILENGFKPVWDAAIPKIISFPFGQAVLFLAFFSLVTEKKNLNKAMTLTYCGVAILLTLFNQLIVLVLGPELAAICTYPLLEVVQVIQMTRVFERADALFILILFIGIGTKAILFYAGAVIGLQQIAWLKYKIWVIPLGIVIYAVSFVSPTYTEFVWIGLHLTVTKVWPIFQIALPALLFVVMLLRKKKRAEGGSKSGG
ncbi:GerAB/ArcD/ProY family transporter [Paenibacillus sp. J22TS3]|uniref:GerAB/ArcD/ProY family transporter n=1 Tax=Paenibacillus sp. J22TS3 TaxID=2807192 RepID=UPI001B24B6F9|nr:GerAB/ArcD/ProY family transporter [Paenibacillus sp. J22TS3]GIP22847.1 germination protein GerKB [Paenibacillus sp. J22TS3]